LATVLNSILVGSYPQKNNGKEEEEEKGRREMDKESII
jgi:hypothetical protein